MPRFPSRVLQRQLKEIARQPDKAFGSFCAHVQHRREVYGLGHAISALEGLQEEGILPAEEIQTSETGPTARSAVYSHTHGPIMHGLNVLLWEQVIRKGEFSSEEKRRVREFYAADAHRALFRPTGETLTEKDKTEAKKRTRHFDQAALNVAELELFEHIHQTADKVFRRVFSALEDRKDTPHRRVMNNALQGFQTLLGHLEFNRQYRDDVRKALSGPAKPL